MERNGEMREISKRAAFFRADHFLAYTDLVEDKMVFKSICYYDNLIEKSTLTLLLPILIWVYKSTLPCNIKDLPLV